MIGHAGHHQDRADQGGADGQGEVAPAVVGEVAGLAQAAHRGAVDARLGERLLGGQLGALGPLLLVGVLGMFLVLLTLPILLKKEKDPFEQIKKAAQAGASPDIEKKARLRRGRGKGEGGGKHREKSPHLGHSLKSGKKGRRSAPSRSVVRRGSDRAFDPALQRAGAVIVESAGHRDRDLAQAEEDRGRDQPPGRRHAGPTYDGRRVVGAMLAGGGLVWLMAPGISAPPLVGALLMFGAGGSWGIYSLLGRGSEKATLATAGNFTRAVPMALVPFVLLANSESISATGIGYAVASGALASGLGYTLWYAVLPSLSALTAATVQLSVPIIAAFGGFIWLGEAMTTRLLVASIAVLGGIALFIMNKQGISASNEVKSKRH